MKKREGVLGGDLGLDLGLGLDQGVALPRIADVVLGLAGDQGLGPGLGPGLVNRMIWLLLIITFVCLVLISFSRDSFMNRELSIYNLVSTKPYLKRMFILDTYKTFED